MLPHSENNSTQAISEANPSSPVCGEKELESAFNNFIDALF
jgi:hypothetical protein